MIDQKRTTDNKNKNDSNLDNYKNDQEKNILIIGELQKETKKLIDELETLKDSVIREKAENENIRKRFKKELENSNKFIISNFVKSLTEQVEDLFRATDNVDLECCKKNNELKTLYQGVEIIKRNLLKTFKNYNIERLYPLNQLFDPKLHEAISQVTNKEKKHNVILNVVHSGYSISGRIIRPASVIVNKNSPVV